MTDADESRGDRDASTRRRLLCAAAAVAGSLAAAGCLSNPWSPGRTGREATAGAPGEASTPGTATDDVDGRASDDATTTSADDGSTTTAATDDGVATDDERTRTDPTATESTATQVPAAERDPDLVVEVAPDGFRYAPETFTVNAGDTVHWVWKDSGHNVRVREKPDGSDWTGTPGGATDTYAEGYRHAHTFEVAGRYEYYCAPHQSLGFEGSFDVE